MNSIVKLVLVSLAVFVGTVNAQDWNASYFDRSYIYYVCTELEPYCQTENLTNADKIAVITPERIVYTDTIRRQLSIVNISNIYTPTGIGRFNLTGTPTSITTLSERYAAVAVTRGPNNTQGGVDLIDAIDKVFVGSFNLTSNPPTSITASVDGKKLCVASSAGTVTIITTSRSSRGVPARWAKYVTGLTAQRALHTSVRGHTCHVTLTTGFAVIDMDTNQVKYGNFDTEQVVLRWIDTVSDGRINQVNRNTTLRRPVQSIWMGSDSIATANIGSNGMTLWNTTTLEPIYDSKSLCDIEAVRVGHYSDTFSATTRTDIRGISSGDFETPEFPGSQKFIFLLSEQTGLVYVFYVPKEGLPVFWQVLPGGAQPSGIAVIESRNMLLVSSKYDTRNEKHRARITIYEYGRGDSPGVPTYPRLVSAPRTNKTFIPFSALSALAAAQPYKGETAVNPKWDVLDRNILYSVEDSFYRSNRILQLTVPGNTSVSKYGFPVVVTGETRIVDTNDKLLAALISLNVSTVNVTNFVNADKTVNIDPEGISVSAQGGFWIASEGNGNAPRYTRPNMLLKVSFAGVIEQVIFLPASVVAKQIQFGFEGVAEDWATGKVAVAFQREWTNETQPRIGLWDPVTSTWKFAFYPLNKPTAYNGWTGISDICFAEDGTLLVLERDNHGGPDARVKLITKTSSIISAADGSNLTKVVLVDGLADWRVYSRKRGRAPIIEKWEGFTVTMDGTAWLNTDNDGVTGTSGEQYIGSGLLSFS